MSKPEVYIFEISRSSFNTSVILNSYKIPVVVEFMSVWSEPCIKMADELASLATEFAGQFIFAKVDVDEQTELRDEYGIENVPSLKVFKNGEVVRTEEGLMQASELQDMLKTFGIYDESDELRLKARDKHMAGETVEAISLLTQAIKMNPANTRVAMDMIQIFIDLGELEQAKGLFNKLPDNDKNSETGRTLIGQVTFKELAEKTAGKDELLESLAAEPGNNDVRFDLVVCYVAEHDFKTAMDMLFDIIEQEPEYKEGAAKEMVITLCNMLAINDPALAQEFRQRLGSSLN